MNRRSFFSGIAAWAVATAATPIVPVPAPGALTIDDMQRAIAWLRANGTKPVYVSPIWTYAMFLPAGP